MQPLEALIREENLVIAGEIEKQRQAHETLGGLPPPKYWDSIPENQMLQMLPHIAHQPYFGIIVKGGLCYRLEEITLTINGSSLHDEAEFVKTGLEFMHLDYNESMQRAIKGIEQKYKMPVTEQDVSAYLLQFAGRILDYVKSKPDLKQLLLETPPVSDRAKDLEPHETVRKLMDNPRAYVAYRIEQVQRFYNHHIQSPGS